MKVDHPHFLSKRFCHLDMLRGVSALLVLAGHARSAVYVNFGQIDHTHLSLLIKAFYFATGLGHLAVLTFFALSGFLVGGKAFREIVEGRFIWRTYFLRRLTRLWVVIVPVLFITLAFDIVGLAVNEHSGYDGRYYEMYASGPRPNNLIDHSLSTFFGNLLFVQTIFVPTFGTNGPMWSLANEFWYYFALPLPLFVIFGSNRQRKIIAAAIFFILLGMLPSQLFLGGIIWMAGALAGYSVHTYKFEWLRLNRIIQIAALMIFPVAFIIAKVFPDQVSDLVFGILIALLLPPLAKCPSPGKIYTNLARACSEVSYSLYLTHFPLLLLITFVFLSPTKFTPGLLASLIYFSLMAVCIAWAVIMWWCTERNTDHVYSYLKSKLITES